MILNKEQSEIIKYDHTKHMYIDAGAGTGKTFTLVKKIEYNLINGNYNPDEILVLTFTRKAADEIRTRISSTTQMSIDVFTYHSFMYKYLKASGFYNDYTIVDEKEVKKIFNVFKKKYNYDISYKDFIAMQLMLDTIKKKFDEYLNGLNVLTFDMIIEYASSLSVHQNEELNKFMSKYKYLYLDEFQDTDSYQLHFVINIVKNNNLILTMVGDPSQSIYQWRGANPNNFFRLAEVFDMKKFSLKKNFRSDGHIIDMANKVVNKLEPTKYYTNKVKFIHRQNSSEELYKIINEINKLKLYGYNYSDICILSRKNVILKNIEQALIRNNIPYNLVSNTNLFDKVEVRVIIEFIKLLMNPYDINAFMYIKSFVNIKGVGEKRLSLVSKDKNISVLDILKKQKNFIEFYNNLKSKNNHINIILDIVNYLDLINKYKNEENRIENIYTFVDICRSVKSLEEVVDLYFEYKDSYSISSDKINLMTIHASKGLEFPVVFLVGLEDNIFPAHGTEIEEELNNLYVAITRAKDILYITTASTRYLPGGTWTEYAYSTFSSLLNLNTRNKDIDII